MDNPETLATSGTHDRMMTNK